MGKDKEKNEVFKQAYKAKMKAKAKERKQNLKEKRAKLVVKNLSFNVTAEDLKAFFEKFGKVINVDLVKKEDGSLVGCGFVQFEAVQKAAKARHHLNGKEFMGRALECDFAMPKKQFDRKVYQEKRDKFWLQQKIKEEPIDTDEIKQEVKEDEENSDNDNNEVQEVQEVKEESDEDNNEVDEDSQMNSNEENKEKNMDADQKSSSEGEDSDDDEEEEEKEKDEESSDDDDNEVEEDDTKEADLSLIENDKGPQTSEQKPGRFESHDVSEGKTIFIKNLPFEATNQDLKECMMQFGPIYYALVCVDKMTEHSKGTGFIKFRFKEDADRCLQAGSELTCLGTTLDCHYAVDRNELQNKMKEKQRQKQKDSRNLYLIKEGVVLAGTKAAEGVSAGDMAKRLQLEQYKTQLLRNLNMFISRYRLVVHNLPITWDDSKLRALVKKHAGEGAVINEARIMRNLKNVDVNGVGASKGHGFVKFTTHEHALNALRSLNNNPHVFSESKRPIVGFSIENRVMLNVQRKRLEKSQLLNPSARQFDANAKKEHQEWKKRRLDEDQAPEGPFGRKGPFDRKGQFGRKGLKVSTEAHTEVMDGKTFSGTMAKPGQIQKMRTRYKLGTQAQLHQEQLKSEKQKKKQVTKTLTQRKKDFIRQDGQKINKQKQDRDFRDDSFAKLVNSYKSKLIKANSGNKSTTKARGNWADG